MKFAFVVSTNVSYLFGLHATMNAQRYFGTNAHYEIVGHEIDPVYQDKLSQCFPVTWSKLTDVVEGWKGDGPEPCLYWTAPWIRAYNVIDQYDAICILQGDEFCITNLNPYFQAASSGLVIATEYTSTWHKFEDLPFGQGQVIYNRHQYSLYDQLVFVSPKHKQILHDTALQQYMKPWKDEANHPMAALNQACVNHLTKDEVIGLDGHLWAVDMDTCEYRLNFQWDKLRVWNERKCQIRGFHNRWWWEGRAQTELDHQKAKGEPGIPHLEIGRHHYNGVRKLMETFNEMSPETARHDYYKGPIE